LFSYGSGAQGEFFTGILQADFKEMVRQADVEKLIMARKQVSVPEYERLFRAQIGYNSKNVFLDLSQDHEKYVLQGQQDQKRIYLIQ
jgi:hydroxymethylglutaryl-CoA synthase